jgi:hypothetical protein
MGRNEFLKMLVEDINSNTRKSWSEYGKMLETQGEELRGAWRSFVKHHYPNKRWGQGQEFETGDYEKATAAIEKNTPIVGKKLPMSALKDDGTIMSIEEYCEFFNIDKNQVKTFKLVTHAGNGAYYNITSRDISSTTDASIEQAFEDIIQRYNKVGVKTFEPTNLKEEIKSLKVTISDAHVGLNPNPNNLGLFKYEYNAEVYKNSVEKVYNSIIKEFNIHGTFDVLLLDDLGDREDGFGGQTTRGGHALPQNMTNAEVFDVIVDTNVKLVESIVAAKVANKIILRCVSNSNHSHDFALIINKAIQKIINRLYSTDIVDIEILEKFIEHRVYGDHCFIITHGKDESNLKFGMPLKLDHKTINFINEYIDHYEINSKYIHFEKGDLHQIGYERTKKFDYRNYMSFAPPSCWQQHNFGDSYSGFSIQVVPKYSNEISHCDYFLDYKKVK